ncbi:MAG TPA: 4Fe-4S dicluster domain-containing protein [Acetobacteraceae bacterium]|nr:4Fe-4S dicluster domain-containing protein [Acetobacteraceae bacterium]
MSGTVEHATPQAAALRAWATETVPEPGFVALESAGVVLIYGRDERAIEAGDVLAPHLDVTVLLRPEAPPRRGETHAFPIAHGRVRTAKGGLGEFELTIDAFAAEAGRARDGAVSRCDLILDLSGGAPLFPPGLRDGYLRADPDSPTAVRDAIAQAHDLVGQFEKTRYIAFQPSLCAHSRSGIVGCRRCLDLCPAGAITPSGAHVSIDPVACAGCGQCAAACPTGAASYAVPPVDAAMRQLRALLLTYRREAGADAVVLVHDGAHGAAVVGALDLPPNMLPLPVNEITQVGIEMVAAAFAYGAGALRFLSRGRPRHSIAGLEQTVALADAVLGGLGFGAGRVAIIGEDDPYALQDVLAAVPVLAAAPRPSSFLPMGEKRALMRFALRELHRAAPAPVDVIDLPPGAPFGGVALETEACTLCLACVSSCPTGALSADPDRPALRFTEEACVQCGLCQATCPEKVISLVPQLDFRTSAADPRTLKEEEPCECLRCGKKFGVASTIARVTAKLAQHWMYRDQPWRLDLIRMCDNCRAGAVAAAEFDPHAKPRAPVRTTEDYMRERAAAADPPC